MSTGLMASTRRVAPIFSTSGTAARRFATAVRSGSARGTPAGGIPANAFRSFVPKRWAEQTALALVPVARRRIEEQQLEPVLPQGALYPSGIESVDEEDLHSPESRFRRCPEAVVHVQLGPQHGEICCEARHASLLPRAIDGHAGGRSEACRASQQIS